MLAVVVVNHELVFISCSWSHTLFFVSYAESSEDDSAYNDVEVPEIIDEKVIL